jgi:hypothetical protein
MPGSRQHGRAPQSASHSSCRRIRRSASRLPDYQRDRTELNAGSSAEPRTTPGAQPKLLREGHSGALEFRCPVSTSELEPQHMRFVPATGRAVRNLPCWRVA